MTVPRANELQPAVNAEISDELVQVTPVRGRPFVAGNTHGKIKRPKLATIGIDTKYIQTTDQRYVSALRKADYYIKRRMREMTVLFGYVSAGTASILASAGLNLGISRYLHQLAADEDLTDNGARGHWMKLIELASKLSQQARQAELTAWELCARENTWKPKETDEAPWLKSIDQEQAVVVNDDEAVVVTEEEQEPGGVADE